MAQPWYPYGNQRFAQQSMQLQNIQSNQQSQNRGVNQNPQISAMSHVPQLPKSKTTLKTGMTNDERRQLLRSYQKDGTGGRKELIRKIEQLCRECGKPLNDKRGRKST